MCGRPHGLKGKRRWLCAGGNNERGERGRGLRRVRSNVVWYFGGDTGVDFRPRTSCCLARVNTVRPSEISRETTDSPGNKNLVSHNAHARTYARRRRQCFRFGGHVYLVNHGLHGGVDSSSCVTTDKATGRTRCPDDADPAFDTLAGRSVQRKCGGAVSHTAALSTEYLLNNMQQTWVPVALRLLANCYTPFTLTFLCKSWH